MYLIIIIKEKKGYFVLISIEEKLCKEMNVKVDFYDKAKLIRQVLDNNKHYAIIIKTKKEILRNSFKLLRLSY